MHYVFLVKYCLGIVCPKLIVYSIVRTWPIALPFECGMNNILLLHEIVSSNFGFVYVVPLYSLIIIPVYLQALEG